MGAEIKVCPWCGGFYRDLTHCQRDGQALEPSEGIVDRYRIVDRIGVGGMGAVYKAEHTMLGNRVVAIKLLHREHSRDQSLVQRFFREAKAASTVDNEHIVRVIDFGVTDLGDSFLVMEHVEGRALRTVIDEEAPLSLERAFSIGVQITEGLYAAHRQGIVHRDLKPENVLITEGKEGEFVKLLDFGIAQLSEYQDARITRAGMIIGTPAYMAPEQASGDPVDQRADIYALGTILYEMLVGRCPFEGESAKKVLVAQLTQTPVPPRQLRADIPSSIERVILRALNKAPDQRPKTMMYLAYELRDALTRQTGGVPVIDDGPAIDDDPAMDDGFEGDDSDPELIAAIERGDSTAEIKPGELETGVFGAAGPRWATMRNLLLIGGVVAGMALGVVVTLFLVRGEGERPESEQPIAATPTADAGRSQSRAVPRVDAGMAKADAAKRSKTTRTAKRRAAAKRARRARAARVPSARKQPAASDVRSFVRLVSAPRGAKVYDGKQLLGHAPLSVATAYARTIAAHLPGHSDRVLHLKKGQTGKVVARLSKQRMSWEVLSLRQLKKMLADGQISRFSYERRKRELLRKRDAKLLKLRVEHKMGHWTKEQYERQAKAIKDSYK